MNNEPITLAQMNAGQTGTIIKLQGGHGMLHRLESMGIREGTRITKVSAQWMNGPVVLRRNNTELAVGYGMAKGIYVHVEHSRGVRS